MKKAVKAPMKGMKEEGKGHASKELQALRRGGASKSMIASERAEYGMKRGGMVRDKK